MPRQFINTYNPTTPLGAAVNNLAAAFFSGPTPYEIAESQADIAYKNQLIRSSQINDRKTLADIAAGEAGAAAMGDLTSFVTDFNANYNPADGSYDDYARGNLDNLYGLALKAGIDADKLGDLGRALLSGYGSDELVIRALAAAGNPIGVNDAVSLAGQTAVADRNVTNAIREAWGKPLSMDQVAAIGLRNDLPNMSERDRGTLYGIYGQPDWGVYELTGGGTGAFDAHAPMPLVLGVATPGEPAQTPTGEFRPDGSPVTTEEPTLELANIVRKIGHGTDDDTTTSIATDMARAAAVGLTFEEYRFAKEFEAASKNYVNMNLMPPESKAEYQRIMQKSALYLSGGSASGNGGFSGGRGLITDPLPEGAVIIPPQ